MLAPYTGYDEHAHKPQEAQPRVRVKVRSPTCLKLLSVICIETSHYVCFTRADDGRWIFHDSMANRVCEFIVNVELNHITVIALIHC